MPSNDERQQDLTEPEGRPVAGPDIVSTPAEGVAAAFGGGPNPEEVVSTAGEQRANFTEALTDNTPSNWEECYMDSPEDGVRTVDFEKMRSLLYAKMRNGKDRWSPIPELALAIVRNPGKEEPFSLGVFTPTKSKDTAENEKNKANLAMMIKYCLISAGAPTEFRTEQFIEQFITAYKRRLKQVRKRHHEVRVNNTIALTATEVTKYFLETKRAMKTRTASGMDETLALYEQAHRLFKSAPEIIAIEQHNTVTDDDETEVPEYFFGMDGNDDQQEYQDRFISLAILMNKIGFLDLTEYEQICREEEMINHNNEPTNKLMRKLSAMQKKEYTRKLLKRLEVIMWSGRKAINFLKNGENMYRRMQNVYLAPNGVENVDVADYLEDLKNMSPYELLAYAADTENPTDFRHQAVMLAFIGMQFIGIRISPHYKNGDKVERKMRKTFLDKIKWERDPEHNQQLKVATHTYHSNGRGDYQIDKDSEYNLEREMKCRIWKGLSGHEYHVRIIDDEHVQKSKASILFKSLLKNSQGDPQALFDLVRFTFVFANVTDLNDPTVRKDIYHLLYTIGIEYGMYPKMATGQDRINWESDDADTIYAKLTKNRSAMGSGYFTLEDKTQKKKGGISSAAIEDIKLVGRDTKHSTGQEIQCQTLASYLAAISAHEEAGHALYDDRKARKLLQQMNPSYLYPATYLRLEAISILEEEYVIRRSAHKISLQIKNLATMERNRENYKQFLELSRKRSELLAKAEKVKAQALSILELIKKVEDQDSDLSELSEQVTEAAMQLADLREAA